MTLAEALLKRKELTQNINSLQSRYIDCAVIEDGTEPEESANEVFQALLGEIETLNKLIVNVNKTNNTITFSDGMTLMEKIALRDSLKIKVQSLGTCVGGLRMKHNPRSYSNNNTTKMVLAEGVTIQSVSKLHDNAAAELRKLDIEIQASNWANSLVE